MKRTFIAIFTALIMSFSTMVIVAPSASADTLCSRVKVSSRTAEKAFESTARMRIYYKVCSDGRGTWTRVISANGSWVHEKRGIPCGWEQPFEGVRFTLRVADNTGNKASRVFAVGCRESGRGSVSVKLGRMPKLYHFMGRPDWTTKATEMMSWGIPDRSRVIGAKFF